MATATWIASRVDHGQIRRLADLWQLDIDSASALCTAYNQSLRQLATSDEVYTLKVGEDLERQLPNVKFRVAANCELDAGLSAAEARVRKLLAPSLDRIDSNQPYSRRNCRLVLQAVNFALNAWGDDVFLAIAEGAITFRGVLGKPE